MFLRTIKIINVFKFNSIKLHTHYSEVNHRTPKPMVSYGPNIGHIPRDLRLKDPKHINKDRRSRSKGHVYLDRG